MAESEEDEDSKYLRENHPDKLMLFSDFIKERKKINQERTFLAKQQYLEEIFEDIRDHFVQYKD